MKTTTTNIADLIAKLQEQEAALGDARDVLNTPRAQETFHKRKQELARTITGLMIGIDKPLALLAAVESRRAAVLQKQAEIEQAIADAPDWRTVHGGRERDREYDRQQHLRRQLQMLHEGTLLCGPGVAYEQLSALDQRIDELNTKIATLRTRLDSYAAQAEALLTETVSG